MSQIREPELKRPPSGLRFVRAGPRAEDFAFDLAKVPGAFLRLGLGEDWPALHSAGFDFNDEAIEAGISVMSALARETLARPAGRGAGTP